MCGIAGWLADAGNAPDADALTGMLHAIAHRGPDGEGMHLTATADGSRGIALGHRRLAIIDPEGGRQPMLDQAAGLALIFNGEIYNFRELRAELVQAGYLFTEDSDTEVLLRAYQHWGCLAVQHLRGMFAFALWDAARQRLLLARDRFGEKPLFVHRRGDDVFFASEIKALLTLPCVTAGVDLQAVSSYLMYRYVPGPKTLFEGIRKLPPGHIAVWENGCYEESRYYMPPDCIPAPPRSRSGDVVGEFLAKLDETVAAQMVSDVPFGAFLSGGIDSSAIVSLMARHSSQPVRTYSVGFAESKYSELSYAAETARCFGTDHHELVISHHDVMKHLPELVRFRDAPVSEPSDVPIYLLAKEASRVVKMVLTGEGSDEVLGGYPKHVAEHYTAAYQLLPGSARSGLIEPLVRALPFRFHRVKTAVANLGLEDCSERYVRWFGAMSVAERAQLSRLDPQDGERGRAPQFGSHPENSALRRILYFDQTSWLPDNLLERGDRMSMAASLEARVPFLDHQLVAFVSSLPDDCRVRGSRTKWILRTAMHKLVPERILTRRKVGFRVPVNEWFRTTMRDYLLEHLQSDASLTRKYYHPQALRSVVSEHLDGRQNHEKLLWSLLNLEIWHRQHV